MDRAHGRMRRRGRPGDRLAGLGRVKRTFTDPIPAKQEARYTELGVDTFHGTARFMAPGRVAVDGRTLQARHILIVRGARPVPLSIPGEDLVVTSVLAGDIRGVFAWAVVPGLIAVLLMIFGVNEPKRSHAPGQARLPIRRQEVRDMGHPFWWVVAVGVVFTLARFSEAFLVLRVQGVGLRPALTPLVLIVMNLLYAAVAAPAGSLSDRMDRRALLAIGLGILILADLALALLSSIGGVLFGVVLWGVHMGVTQGLLSALVADAAPDRLRGTAFGVFNLATGLTLLVASGLAGILWSRFGAPTTFLAGGAFCAVALAGLMLFRARRAT